MKKICVHPGDYQNKGDAKRINKQLAGAVHVETYTRSEVGWGDELALVIFAFYPDYQDRGKEGG